MPAPTWSMCSSASACIRPSAPSSSLRGCGSRCSPTPRCARTSVRATTTRHHTEREPATTARNARLLLQGAADQLRHLVIVAGAGSSRAKRVMQSLNAASDKSSPPFAHRRRGVEALGDRRIGQSLRTAQNDAGALDQAVGHQGGPRQSGQLLACSLVSTSGGSGRPRGIAQGFLWIAGPIFNCTYLWDTWREIALDGRFCNAIPSRSSSEHACDAAVRTQDAEPCWSAAQQSLAESWTVRTKATSPGNRPWCWGMSQCCRRCEPASSGGSTTVRCTSGATMPNGCFAACRDCAASSRNSRRSTCNSLIENINLEWRATRRSSGQASPPHSIEERWIS